jgi:UDP-glucose:(heptosyl)LPS alpha-1,3-glucosyltransferase
MESHLAQLVVSLASRGHRVTVVARTCRLPQHAGVRWVRVPGPRRPFPLAYPWFFLAGTVQVARSRRDVLHTTGAIVFNHADLSTIHHCHQAAHPRVTVHPNRVVRGVYAVNAWLSYKLSLIAERVYNPSWVCS